jgi:hypothetical protein
MSVAHLRGLLDAHWGRLNWRHERMAGEKLWDGESIWLGTTSDNRRVARIVDVGGDAFTVVLHNWEHETSASPAVRDLTARDVALILAVL